MPCRLALAQCIHCLGVWVVSLETGSQPFKHLQCNAVLARLKARLVKFNVANAGL